MGRCIRGAAVVPPHMHTLRGRGWQGLRAPRGPPAHHRQRAECFWGKEAGCLCGDPDFCIAALCRWDEVTPAWGLRSTPWNRLRLCSAGSDVL